MWFYSNSYPHESLFIQTFFSSQKMIILFLLGLVPGTRASDSFLPRDPCSLVYRESRCEESGLCRSLVPSIEGGLESSTDLDSTVSCSDAYMSLANMMDSTTIPDPPIIVPIGHGKLRSMVERQLVATQSTYRPPSQGWYIPNVTLQHEFTGLIDSLAIKFSVEFPEIIFHPPADAPLLRHLVRLSRDIGRSMTPITSSFYQSHFANIPSVRRINWHLQTAVLSIYTTRSIEMRRAKISHSIPFFHAWSSVYYYLDFPTLFSQIGTVCSFSFMVNRDTLYPTNSSEKVWVIGLPAEFMETKPTHFVIPPVVENLQSDFPLEAFEFLASHTGQQTDVDDPLTILNHAIDRISTMNFTSSRCLSSTIEFLETVLFVVQEHPQVTREMREIFCHTTKDSWEAFFQAASSPIHLHPEAFASINLLRLFDICGPLFLTLRDRVAHVLPAIAGVRFISDVPIRYEVHYLREPITSWLPEAIELIRSIPIYHIRRWMLIAFYSDDTEARSSVEEEQAEYMSFLSEILFRLSEGEFALFEQIEGRLVPTESETPDELFVFGSVVALLVVYGDPRGALSDFLARESGIPNLYFNSNTVRRGFCHVVNCDIFDTLFVDSDVREILDLMRTFKPLARSSRVHQ